MFDQKWPFFYKFILLYLKGMKSKIMKAEQMEIFEILKSSNGLARANKGENDDIEWVKLMKKASEYELKDLSKVERMINTYNPETRTSDE